MKADAVYRTLREALAPFFRAGGFKRTSSLLGWSRPHDDNHVVVWCQVSQDGWDAFAGSKFTVEFQVSEEPVIGTPAIRRCRLPRLLGDAGREEIRVLQNRVIASLARPPRGHPLLLLPEPGRQRYLEKFKTIDRPYGPTDDIWLRYGRQEHIESWAAFVLRELPGCLRQAETWGASTGVAGIFSERS